MEESPTLAPEGSHWPLGLHSFYRTYKLILEGEGSGNKGGMRDGETGEWKEWKKRRGDVPCLHFVSFFLALGNYNTQNPHP